MAALILALAVLVTTLWLTAIVQRHARWKREEPADDAWIAELQKAKEARRRR
jgi:hypothetical protein